MAFKKKTTKTVAATVTAVEKEQAVEKAATFKVDTVLTNVVKVQQDVQNKFAEIQVLTTNALNDLNTVNQAIDAQKGKLKEYYEVEVAATTLADLQAAIEEARARADEDRKELEKSRLREEEEFQYELEKTRREEQDEFDAERAAEIAEFEAAQALKQKQLDERDAVLKAAENELAELRKIRDGQQATIDKAVKAAEAILTNVLTKDFRHKEELAKKDAAFEKSELSRELAAFKAENEALKNETARLRTDLTNANSTIKELGAKALDSSSGRASLEAVQKVLEQQQPVANAKGR